MFSFVIWDSTKQILFAARDRLGVKPFHYYLDDEKLLFGSEIKSILAHEQVDATMDALALSDYFSFMSIPAPRTIYRRVRKLLPGHSMIVEGSDVRIQKYWDLEYGVENKPDAFYMEQFEELLADATRLRLISDVPLGAFLSGGVDSSAVVAMMSKSGASDIKTFSIAFHGQEGFDESSYARRVAEQYHTRHTEFNLSADFISVLPKLIWHFDEPFAVSSGFALYYLARMTREHVTVALSGDGGDELFAGYPFRYSHDERYAKLTSIPMPLRKMAASLSSFTALSGDSRLAAFSRKLRDFSAIAALPSDEAFIKEFSYFDHRMKSTFFTPDFYRQISDHDSNSVFMRYYAPEQNGSQLFKRQMGDIKTTLADEMLKKVDNMTMAVSLEARTPFLDYRMAEFSASLPDHLKIQGREGKWIVKKVMEKYLDKDILYRKKHGFNVPFSRWARKELVPYLMEVFSEAALKESNILDYKQVHRMLRLHQHGTYDYGNHIYMLLVFELWRRQSMV
jgi:asparagine synthase (glutamine-hydrolysing)